MPPKAPQHHTPTTSGILLLALGTAIMLAYFGTFGWRLIGTCSPGSLYTALGMASLHVFQVIAFDHSPFFPIALQMLVLFSAFTMTLIGIALLSKRAIDAAAPGMRPFSALPKGDQ